MLVQLKEEIAYAEEELKRNAEREHISAERKREVTPRRKIGISDSDLMSNFDFTSHAFSRLMLGSSCLPSGLDQSNINFEDECNEINMMVFVDLKELFDIEFIEDIFKKTDDGLQDSNP